MTKFRLWKTKKSAALTTMLVALVCLLSAPSSATAQESSAPQPEPVGYFDPSEVLNTDFAVALGQNAINTLSSQALNALDYIRQNLTHDTLGEIERTLPRYNRREHFYGWINADPTTNCLDTRTEVLVRDADKRANLVFKSKCTIAKGLWNDPYTGKNFKISTAIQIDHVVPLKHAYLTGAANWPTSRRCTFSNFLGDDIHLLAVSGHENMSKGGKGPDGYLPPNEAYVCEYIENWMKIKAVWELKSTDEELAAVERAVSKYACSPNRFKMTAAQITAARAATNDAPARCRVLDSGL